jgi:hypothetical protein
MRSCGDPSPPSLEIGSQDIRILPLTHLERGGGGRTGNVDGPARTNPGHVTFSNASPRQLDSSASHVKQPAATSSNALVCYDAVGLPIPAKVYGRSMNGRVLPMTIDEIL